MLFILFGKVFEAGIIRNVVLFLKKTAPAMFGITLFETPFEW